MPGNKILLIRPQNLYRMQNYPPLGLILIGTVLERAGYNCQILADKGTPDDLGRISALAEGARLVGLTATTAEAPRAIRIARMLRKDHGRSLPLVWGGWHPTLFPAQMAASDLVDFAVAGDGETAILDIAASLAGEKPPLTPKLVSNGPIDLETLPLPDYRLVEALESFIQSPLTDKFQEYCPGGLRWLPYQSSRGCPHACAFCINPVTGNRRYRCKSAAKTAREMVSIAKEHRLGHVKIIDDNFFVNIRRARKVFENVQELGGGFTWDAECRIDYFKDGCVDDATLAFFRQRGLVQLTFGIESGSTASLGRMRKGFRAEGRLAEKAVAMCREHDIVVRGSFILDVPGDTREDILATVKLIRKLRRYPKFACGVHTYRPYPKSPLAERLFQEGKIRQPDRLEGWAAKEIVRQYTDTAVQRTWLDNHRLSSRISFYESLESAFWLKAHQLKHPILRRLNRLFIQGASLRNRYRFYAFPLDKFLYLHFKNWCAGLPANPSPAGKGK